MGRPVTLCTCQWADLPFDELCVLAKKMGYDGLEVACWGNGIDIDRALTDDNYVAWIKENLEKNGLIMKALACHIIGQCVGDAPDPRLNNFAPAELADQPEAIRNWGIETMKKAPAVAEKFGVKIITGFTGSPIWRYLYSFPQTTEQMVEDGFDEIVRLWSPILDEFKKHGVVFALEVHPGEIAFDYYSTKKLLEKFADRPEFGLNFDPSHLIWQGIKPHLFLQDFIDRVYHVLWSPILDEFKKHGVVFALEVHPGEIAFDYYSTKKLLEKFADRPEFGLNFDPSHLIWQGIKPHLFLQDFIDRVYHVHMKDAAVTLDGRSGLLGSHIDFGDLRRGWNFRSLGHGDVNFEEIIRVLNAGGYDGPLSVEWEDSGMDRIDGATEAAAFVHKVDFKPSAFKFDDAIAN